MTEPSAPNTATTTLGDDEGQLRPELRGTGFLRQLPAARLGLLLAAVGMLLSLPALWSGFAQDDYFFLMVFKGHPGLDVLDQTPLETFSFSKGEIELQNELTERGLFPWWVVDGWKVNFWRPVSSLSNWLDFRLFGESPWPMHVHSLLLYGLLIATATIMYRRFIPSPYAAGLAGLLFAIDSGHAIPVTWLSMRNALLTLIFGLLVLYAHDRWRKAQVHGGTFRAWLPHGPLALLWLALGLLSGESAVAVGGYLFAYALFLDPATTSSSSRNGLRPYLSSIAALLPYLVVVILWRAVYSGLGYGTEGSGLYVDPVTNAGEFLERLPAHMLVLLLGVFALPDAGLWGLMPSPWNQVHLVGAVLFLAAGTWVIFPLLRQRAEARFLLTGALLAVVPACATLPMDRLMTFSSFGALGLVALILVDIREKGTIRIKRPRWLIRVLAIVLIVANLVVAPAGLLTGTQQITMMNRILTDSNPSIPTDLPESTRIVALNTPIDLLGSSLPIYRSARNEPVPRHWWWLYSGVQEIDVERIGTQTLVLRPEGGYHLPPWSDIFRFSATHPMEPGQTFALDGVTITVLKIAEDGRPTEVQFKFDAPLEDPSYYFVTWQDGNYVPFTLPAPGATTKLPDIQLSELLPVAFGWNAAGAGPKKVAAH